MSEGYEDVDNEHWQWSTLGELLDIAARHVQANPSMWHLGDGQGGGLFHEWEEALARIGFAIQPPISDGKPKRKPTKAETALRVFRADRFQCIHCGTSENLTVDHVIPVSKGGPHEIENMQTLCGSCNSVKGDR